MLQIRRTSLLWKIVIAASLLLGGGGAVYYYLGVERGPIYEFNEARDLQSISDLFKTDWYWLATEPYSPEQWQHEMFLFEHRTPIQNPFYYGKLRIKVLREQDTFVGFIAYYRKTMREGDIVFVAIKPEFRGKHYAEKLMSYAFDDLKKMGVTSISLITRPSNTRGIGLYQRLGFVETARDDVHVFFTKKLK